MSEPCPSSHSTPTDDFDAGGKSSADPVPPDEPVEPSPTGAEEDLGVQLLFKCPDVEPPLSGWIEGQLARIANRAGVRGGRVNLVVVNDGIMTDLNDRYRHEIGVTDVLTFDLRDGDRPGPGPSNLETDGAPASAFIEADVVICLDEAVRQAQRRGHDARDEVLLYAVHGVLHLLGENDLDPTCARRMHQREDELLQEAGIGPIFTKS